VAQTEEITPTSKTITDSREIEHTQVVTIMTMTTSGKKTMATVIQTTVTIVKTTENERILGEETIMLKGKTVDLGIEMNLGIEIMNRGIGVVLEVTMTKEKVGADLKIGVEREEEEEEGEALGRTD